MPDIDPYYFAVAEWCYRNPITTVTLLAIFKWITQQTSNTLDDTLYNRAATWLGRKKNGQA